MDDISETDLTDGDAVDDVERIDDPEEVDGIDRDIDSMDDQVRELIDAILDDSDETLRLVARYDGDEFEVVYAREDVTAGFTEPELAGRVKTFVMQGLGEPDQEQSLYDFGRLEATVRWYDEAVVAHLPVDEWSGLVFTFDRRTESLEALAGQFF
jgi:GGDEF domain-containing protein